MGSKKCRVFYADLWGLREEKYDYLLKNDVTTTGWQELQPIAPYYFFVPKDFSLQDEYEKFCKITEIFREWSSGVQTHRDHFIVGFTEEEVRQKMQIFTGGLPDELVRQGLNLRDTRDWKIQPARESVKEIDWTKCIRLYSYRPFSNSKQFF